MSDGVPKWLEVNPDGIPDELKRLTQWVTWAFEARVEGEQPTKIPYSPRGLPRRAKANDPRTWGDFSAAMKCYTRRDGFAGITVGQGLSRRSVQSSHVKLGFKTYALFL